jgi:DNA replication licensing factor MCM3
VEVADAKQAEEIMRFALFREVPKRAPRKKRRLNNGGAVRKGSDDGSDAGESDEEDGSEDEELQAAERMTSPNAPGSRSAVAAPGTAGVRQQRQPQPPADPIWGDDSQDVTMDSQDAPDFTGGPPPPTGDGNVRPERCVLIAASIVACLLTYSAFLS